MKKHFLKSFALIAMLFSAITMSAKQYCGEAMTSTIGWDGVIAYQPASTFKSPSEQCTVTKCPNKTDKLFHSAFVPA